MPAGTVLFSSRAPIGYCAIASNTVSTNQGFKSLVLRDGYVPEFVRYYLLASKDFAEGLASGTTFKELSGSRIAELPIPVPPPSEQRRIVAKLDGLLARSKQAAKELDRIPSLADRYKYALLDVAFCGDLTNDNADKWPRIRLGNVIANIEAGKNIRCEERPPAEDERGIVKVSSVTWGTFDATAAKTPPVDVTLNPNTIINSGDFLISRANTLELVGACVIVSELSQNNLYLSDKVLRVRFTEPVDEWVLYFLRSREGRRQIEQLATGNQLSMRNISQAALREIRLPLPQPPIRQRILDRLQTKLSGLAKVVDDATAAARLLRRFEEAVLAKAFRGALISATPEATCETGKVVMNVLTNKRSRSETVRV